jgi:hypothetical protein
MANRVFGESIPSLHIRSSTLAGNSRAIHRRCVPSRWWAWCGEICAPGVVLSGAVAYHEFCWWRRARVVPRGSQPESMAANFIRTDIVSKDSD